MRISDYKAKVNAEISSQEDAQSISPETLGKNITVLADIVQDGILNGPPVKVGIAYPNTDPDVDPVSGDPVEHFTGETWLVDTASYGETFVNFGNQVVPLEQSGRELFNVRFVWNAGAWGLQYDLKPDLNGYVKTNEAAQYVSNDNLFAGFQNRTTKDKFPYGNLPTLRYKSLSDTDVPSESQTPTIDGLAIVGYTDLSLADNAVVYRDTSIKLNSGLKRVSIVVKIDAIKSASPMIGLGFGALSGSSQCYGYRKSGALYRSTDKFTFGTIGASIPVFAAGDTIRIEVEPTESGCRVRTAKNGTYSDWAVRPDAIGGNILLATRGSANYTVSLELLLSDNYVDSGLNNMTQYVDSLTNFYEEYTSEKGVSAPASGVNMNTSNLNQIRLFPEPISAPDGSLLTLTSLECYCATSGDAVILFYEKAGSTYTLRAKKKLTVTVGLNSFDQEDIGTLQVPNHSYIGFYSSLGTGGLSGINPGSGINSLLLNGAGTEPAIDSTISSPTNSSYILQFKASLKIEVSESLKASVQNIKENINGVYYVAKTGSDESDGGINTPFLTIGRAISACVNKSVSTVVIGQGDYREVLPFDLISSGAIRLYRHSKSVVRVLGSDKLTDFIKTSGRTNIYEAPFSAALPSWSFLPSTIFEHGKQSTPILYSERHPLQKGLSSRLPFTPIIPITPGADLNATLTALDAQPGKYYYDTAAHKIYLHTSGSDNPSSNGYRYEVPQRDFNTVPSVLNQSVRPELQLVGIQFLYGRSGVWFAGFSYVKRIRCTAIGVAGAITGGAFRDDTAIIESYKDEAAYSDGDGINGHYSVFSDYASQDLREGAGLCKYVDVWTHDNGDDGMSHHERHDLTIIGGLFEYNGDRGLVPAQGCQATGYSLLARKNGQVPAARQSGAGFEVTNAAVDGRNSTSLTLYTSISEENYYGYAVSGGDDNYLTAYSCVARNNINAEFRQSQGILTAINCRASNPDPGKIKLANEPAKLVVINDDALL